MNSPRRFAAALLALVAAVSSLWVWQMRSDDGPPMMVGPPRSDYLLYDFELVALDEVGKESFMASGPRLTRHPNLGTLDIETPQFSSPDASGDVWTSSAKRAWVNKEGSELRMLGAAEVRGPSTDKLEPILLRSESLTVFPRENRVVTEAAVTVTEPGSILTATGMRANLDTQRVELLSDVHIHYEGRQFNARTSTLSKP